MTGEHVPEPPPRPVVVVAGAGGFIGAALAVELGASVHRRGLSRSARAPGSGGYDAWVACDLFSLRDAEKGLRGATTAVYLVHSMMPSARLSQGAFEDMDLVCADNFARAARLAGVERIVYLGGLLPPDDATKLSRHLASRREVEETLASYGVPVVTLRAGLVIGPGGSSWAILSRLVRRLPVMACPRWTRTMTQPIALPDAVALIAACTTRADVAAGAYDIGGPDVVSYQQMMQRTAQAMGLRRPMMSVPLLTVGLSRLWVSLITRAPKELVAPLIESLMHPMVARDRALQERLGIPGRGLDQALVETLAAEQSACKPVPALGTRARSSRLCGLRERLRVGSLASRDIRERQPAIARSVQRLALPSGRDAAWVAEEYVRWLPTWLIARVLRVTVDADKRCRFYGPFMKRPLLELSLAPDRSSPDRVLFYITGGCLARVGAGRGRLEFREVLHRRAIIAAVHDFEPSLPWFLYASTQAIAHLAVMRAFGRHLRRMG